MTVDDNETVSNWSSDRSVSLCGLGNMGSAIMSRLVRYGNAIGFDPNSDRVQQTAKQFGCEIAKDLSEVASSNIVVLSLPNPTVSMEVVVELLPDLSDGTVIVETSTVNPLDMWKLRDLIGGRKIGLIDAAILSGVTQMVEGTSTLLVGGNESDINAVNDVLSVMAGTIKHLGPLGTGSAAKVINNAVAHAVMVLLCEAGALGAVTGVSGDQLLDLLSNPEAGLIRPLTYRFAERVLTRDFEGGMPTDAACKDSGLVLAMAQTSHVPLFAIQAAHTVYELGLGAGLGRSDYASIASLWEGWTGRKIQHKIP